MSAGSVLPLRAMALTAVVRCMLAGAVAYSEPHFRSLPTALLARLLDRCKQSNLVDASTLCLFFAPGAEEFVLSGVSSYVDGRALQSCQIATRLGPSIRTLGLYNCGQLDSVSIELLLRNVPSVTNVNLGRLKALNDNHVRQLSKWCPKIETLVLNRNAQLTDCLAVLAELPNLRELSLFSSARLVNVADNLSQCPGLTSLNLTQVNGFDSAESWAHLVLSCPLIISFTAQKQKSFTAEAFAVALKCWKHLQSIDIVGCNISGEDAVLVLDKFPRNLQKFSMSGSDPVLVMSDQIITPGIRTISLHKNLNVDPVALAERLTRPTGLETFLALRPLGQTVSDPVMFQLLHRHGSTLRELYLTGAKAVTPKWFEELAPCALPRLKVLEMADVPSCMHSLALERLVQACPRLTQLNLSKNPILVESSAELSYWLGPRLKSLSLADSGGFGDEFVLQSIRHPWARL